MSNKFIFFQLLAVTVCAFLFAYFFASDLYERDFRKQTRHEISLLKKQVEDVQNVVNTALDDINAAIRMHTSPETEINVQDPSKFQLEDIEAQLNEVWEMTAAFEQNVAGLSRRLEKIEGAGSGGRTGNGAWFNDLPEEKREIVQEIYQQAMAPMQGEISSLPPGGIAPSAEEMMKAIQYSREVLKERLKDVLNEEEYQSFIESLAASPLPRVAEPIQ